MSSKWYLFQIRIKHLLFLKALYHCCIQFPIGPFLFTGFSYQSKIQFYSSSSPLIIGDNLKFTGLFFLNDMVYLEGHSGGKVNILGGDFIGHCKKKKKRFICTCV